MDQRWFRQLTWWQISGELDDWQSAADRDGCVDRAGLRFRDEGHSSRRCPRRLAIVRRCIQGAPGNDSSDRSHFLLLLGSTISVMFLPIAIYMVVRWQFFLEAAILDDKKPFTDALGDSWRCTKGRMVEGCSRYDGIPDTGRSFLVRSSAFW